MKYLIEINREECLACGACYLNDPDHFESGADGKAKVVGVSENEGAKGGFDDGKISEAQVAADSCPVNAIKIE